MTIGRFAGHHLQRMLGEKNIIIYSAICASLGLFHCSYGTALDSRIIRLFFTGFR